MIKHARLAAWIVLIAVTAFGVREFVTGDWEAAVVAWRSKLPILPLVFLLATLAVALEGIGWMWVYSRFGIRSWDAGGATAFLAGRAGLLLPAQLNRLIRPTTMAALDRGTTRDCLKAEAVFFVLDITAVVTLLVVLLGSILHPAAGIVSGMATMTLTLILGNRLAKILSGAGLELPTAFWFRWQTVGTLLVLVVNWTAHGSVLYVLIYDLPGSATLGQALFFADGASIVGAGSGLPGGLGATEGLLGASLSLMNVPAAHLALAVGAFRAFTFWIWIPIGWVALIMTRRRRVKDGEPPPDDRSRDGTQPGTGAAPADGDGGDLDLSPAPARATGDQPHRVRSQRARLAYQVRRSFFS